MTSPSLAKAARECVLCIMRTHPHPRMTLPIMLNRMAREGFTRPQARAAVDFYTRTGVMNYSVTASGVELHLARGVK